MNLVFVKRYNPAYDIFLTRYLRDGGIIVGAEKTWQRTLPMTLAESPRFQSRDKCRRGALLWNEVINLMWWHEVGVPLPSVS